MVQRRRNRRQVEDWQKWLGQYGAMLNSNATIFDNSCALASALAQLILLLVPTVLVPHVREGDRASLPLVTDKKTCLFRFWICQNLSWLCLAAIHLELLSSWVLMLLGAAPCCCAMSERLVLVRWLRMLIILYVCFPVCGLYFVFVT